MIPTCISYPHVLLLCIQATYQISDLFSLTGQRFLLPSKWVLTSIYQGLRSTVHISYHPQTVLCQAHRKNTFIGCWVGLPALQTILTLLDKWLCTDGRRCFPAHQLFWAGTLSSLVHIGTPLQWLCFLGTESNVLYLFEQPLKPLL